MQHIRECHAYSPAFHLTCGMNGCPRTFKNFLTFRTHVYRWHSGYPNLPEVNLCEEAECGPGDVNILECSDPTAEKNNEGEGMLCEDVTAQMDGTSVDGIHDPEDNTMHNLSKTSALFLLQVKEQHKLSQTAAQGILEGVTHLMQVSI